MFQILPVFEPKPSTFEMLSSCRSGARRYPDIVRMGRYMTDDVTARQRAVYGDSGPWVKHLAHLWQGFEEYLKAGQGVVSWQPPKYPDPQRLDELISWWAPLLHATIYGLGSARPVASLAQIADDPTFEVSDPRIRLIRDWWGPHLSGFVAWGYATGMEGHLQLPDAPVASYGSVQTLNDEALRAAAASVGLGFDGGWDPLHLTSHVGVPRATMSDGEGPQVDLGSHGTSPALRCPSYAGWHRQLGDGARLGGQTVEVIVRGLGRLGSFAMPAEAPHLAYLVLGPSEDGHSLEDVEEIGLVGSAMRFRQLAGDGERRMGGRFVASAIPSIPSGLALSGRRNDVTTELTATTLSEALEAAAGTFDSGELEYLSVTGKNELPIRDRLAWHLHRTLEAEGYVVAREWGRVDLAVLKDGLPVAAIEGKACGAFDILREKPNEYLPKLLGDRDKMLALQPRAERAFLTLALTSYGGTPQQVEPRVAKYLAGHQNAAARFGSPRAAQEAAIGAWSEVLAGVGEVIRVPMSSGKAWEFDVCVDVLVIEVT